MASPTSQPRPQTAEELGASIDALFAEVEPTSAPAKGSALTPPTVQPLPQVPTPAGILASADTIIDQMDDLLKQVADSTSTAPQPPPPAPQAKPNATPSIESLDEQIAKLTEEIIESESAFSPHPQPAPPPPRSPSSAGIVPPTAPAPVAPPVTTPPQTSAPTQPAPDRTAPAKPSTSGSPTSPGPQATSQPPIPVAAVAAPSATAAPVTPKARPLLPRVGAAASAVLLPIFALIAKPIAKKPKVLRDSLAWIALNTLFVGACLWFYLLFIRQPAAENHGNGFDINSSHLPQPAAPPPAHAAASDDAHGQPKKDSHAPPKKAAKKSAAKPSSGH